MVREMAAETLGLNANGSLAADQLIAALTDEFWQVRLKAIRSLGKMKVDRAVRPIGGCITHEQANLRKEAAAALGEIADPPASRSSRWSPMTPIRRCGRMRAGRCSRSRPERRGQDHRFRDWNRPEIEPRPVKVNKGFTLPLAV